MDVQSNDNDHKVGNKASNNNNTIKNNPNNNNNHHGDNNNTQIIIDGHRSAGTTEGWSIVAKHLPPELKEGAARTAKELNNSKLLGKKLVVEPAKDNIQKQREKAEREAALRRLKENKPADPICAPLGINYGPPPTLEYKYPPPNEAIMQNIYNAIASVPKLYTQVLHLMNKMNLPPPFASPLPLSTKFAKEKAKKRKADDLVASSESEIESEQEEEDEDTEKQGGPPTKQPLREPQVISHATKTPQKQSPFQFQPISADRLREQHQEISPTTTSVMSTTATSVPTPPLATSSSTQPPIAATPLQNVVSMAPSENRNILNKRNVITAEQLQQNRLSQRELEELPLFKGKPYDPGVANTRIFIRNLHKDTKRSDLEFIYGRYLDSDEAVQKELDINLLGARMKGQAFVTFPHIDMAKKAVEETHGYLLHDKPIIVEFGRVAAPEKK